MKLEDEAYEPAGQQSNERAHGAVVNVAIDQVDIDMQSGREGKRLKIGGEHFVHPSPEVSVFFDHVMTKSILMVLFVIEQTWTFQYSLIGSRTKQFCIEVFY